MNRPGKEDLQTVSEYNPLKRIIAGLTLTFVLPGLLAGSVSIPFVFESPSILYKLGNDKVFLRTGKVIGMIAATLLLYQLLLSGHFNYLDLVFGHRLRYLLHRINAVLLAVLAVAHPLFIFAPEDIRNIPVELKYWPEILGAVLLVLIWLITSTGLWRLFLGFSFPRWRLFHRVATFIAVVMLIFHVLYGSETFESGIPRLIILLAGGIYGVAYGWLKIKTLRYKGKAG